jgi:hypothetical protein
MTRAIVRVLLFLAIFVSSCSGPSLAAQENGVPGATEDASSAPTLAVQDTIIPSETADVNIVPTPAMQDYDVSYEAEDANNSLIGVAARGVCKFCSGERHVGYIGNSTGELWFNKINVVKTGEYNLAIDYINGDAMRRATITINGGEPRTFSFPNSGGWDAKTTLTIAVQLSAGDNIIVFSNPVAGSWAPDIDRIMVLPFDPDAAAKELDVSGMEATWTVELGEPTTISNSAQVPIYGWFPDGHISVLPLGGGPGAWMMFWAEFESYRTIGMSQYPEEQRTLRPDTPVIGKRGDWEGWDNGGSWLMSVHRLSGNELIGFYHAEDHWCCPRNAEGIAWKSIAVTYSHDNGVTWEPGQQIITSATPKPDKPEWGGVGDGVVIWDAANERWVAFYSEQVIHMAISEDPLASPGTWYKWHADEFSEPGLGGQGTPLPGLDLVAGANPSVHWNTHLNEWIMVYHGWAPAEIFITGSKDLIHWYTPQSIISSSRGGRAWYPTIIGDSDVQAGESARIYYADLTADLRSRNFVVRDIIFTSK